MKKDEPVSVTDRLTRNNSGQRSLSQTSGPQGGLTVINPLEKSIGTSPWI